MSTTSGGEKATFIALDASDNVRNTFPVQYNPKEFKYDKSVSWQEHEDQGKDEVPLEYQKGSPASLSMELIFDTTIEEGETPVDVREKWVNGLLSLTNPDVTVTEGNTSKGRPPKVKFIWGTFEMVGVVESVNVSYILFAADGTPLRARCTVKMKEWGTSEYERGQGGAYINAEPVQLVTSKPGDTAASVAQSNNTDWRTVAEANNLDNPADIPPGTILVLPTSS